MVCLNNDHHQFCAKFYKSFPCCKEVDRSIAFHSLVLFNNPEPQSLILQLFELGKLFVEKKIVSFTAQGTCMYPCIRQGDIIYIQPKSAEDIEIGEVAIHRRNNHLFSHRTIAKGQNERGRYIITRPDTAKYGDDGPSYNEDILGVVAHIERKSRVLTPVKRDYNLIEKIWFGFCLKCFCFKQYLLQEIIYLITFLQQFKLYRLIAQLFSQNLYKKIDLIFSVSAYDKLTDRFFRKIPESELVDLVTNSDNNSVLRWTVALKANSKQVASLSFVFRPQNCKFSGWWLIEAQIRIRHRGTVIEKALFVKIDKLLRRMGASEIFVSVFSRAHLEQIFFKGLGFRQVYTYDDGILKDRVKRPLMWLIMQRKIKL